MLLEVTFTKDEVLFENGNKMGNLGMSMRLKAMNAIPILVYSGVGM